MSMKTLKEISTSSKDTSSKGMSFREFIDEWGTYHIVYL